MNTVVSIVRRAKRFRPADLVAESGIPRRTVYALLSGESSDPRISTLIDLERAVLKLEAARAKRFARKAKGN